MGEEQTGVFRETEEEGLADWMAGCCCTHVQDLRWGRTGGSTRQLAVTGGILSS